MILAIIFPNIDPVIFNIIGPISLRWYSLAYIIGIILGLKYFKILSKKSIDYNNYQSDDILNYIIIGIIIGGRLGYVMFYDLEYNLKHPSNIIATWNGGMSFHGGLIGFAIAIFTYTKKKSLDYIRITDLISCVAPIGLFLGRIANFINAELYGRVTSVPWGVIFPGEYLARHPSQIYEALSEGLFNFAILNLLFFKTDIINYKGKLTACFLLIYSISRIIVEFFREPDAHLGFMFFNITLGQLLSIPMIVFAILLYIKSVKNGPYTYN